MATLSIKEGIKIQSEQLVEWKQLLKEHVYQQLEFWAVKYNNHAKDGFDITRGTELQGFVLNYLNGHIPVQTIQWKYRLDLE